MPSEGKKEKELEQFQKSIQAKLDEVLAKMANLEMENSELKNKVKAHEKNIKDNSTSSAAIKREDKQMEKTMSEVQAGVCKLSLKPAYPGTWERFNEGIKLVRKLCPELDQFLSNIEPKGDMKKAVDLPEDTKELDKLIPKSTLSDTQFVTYSVWLRNKIEPDLKALYSDIPDDYTGKQTLFG